MYIPAVAVATALALFVSEPARACSMSCTAAVFPAGGTVPANTPAVAWSLYAIATGCESIQPHIEVVEVLGDGTTSTVPVTVSETVPRGFMARFDRPLRSGASYQVQINDDEGHPLPGGEVTFSAGPEAPLPTTLGTLVVGPERREEDHVRSNSGVCYSLAQISARDVTLDLSDEALPWVSVLDVEWNQSVRSVAEQGELEVEAYHVCSSEESGIYGAFPEGTTRLTASGVIAGSNVAIEPVTVRVSLTCDDGCGGAASGSWLGVFAVVLFAVRRLRVVGAALMVLALAPPARPCSLPCGVTMSPPSGDVPANLPALHFSYNGPFVDTEPQERVRITERLADGGEAELPFTFEGGPQGGVVVFGRALVEGATYRVSIESGCGSEPFWYEQELVAGPSAPLPTTLGTLEVGDEVSTRADVWTVSGSCTSPADVTKRDVTLALSAAAEPWKRALLVTWSHTAPRRSLFGDILPPEDRWRYGIERMAYHVCRAEDDGVEPGDPEGATTVTVSARLPGVATELEAQAGLSLSCADSDEPSCSAGPGSLSLVLVALVIGRWAPRRRRGADTTADRR